MDRQAGNDGKRQVELVVTHRGGVCLRVCECVRARGLSFESTHHRRGRGGGGIDGWMDR